MIKKFFLFFLISPASFVWGYCAYIPCENSVVLSSVQSATNLQKNFLKINYQINALKTAYANYDNALSNANILYTNNKKLKTDYLIILNEIKEVQKKILHAEEQRKKESKANNSFKKGIQ